MAIMIMMNPIGSTTTIISTVGSGGAARGSAICSGDSAAKTDFRGGSKMIEHYYTPHTAQLLKDFDRVCQWFKPHLAERYGPAFADTVLRTAREDYQRLIPQIPYIGGSKVHMTSNLMESVQLLALLRTLKAYGKPPEELRDIVLAGIHTRLSRYPRWLLKLAGWRAFSKPFVRYLQKQGQASQQRCYPEGFVFEVILGDGREFDWGLDFTECGICKFYQAQHAAEFLPLVCLVDYAVSEALGYGLARTQTLAEGNTCCNPRMKKGHPTQWRLPTHAMLHTGNE
jgi:hypothetical protein